MGLVLTIAIHQYFKSLRTSIPSRILLHLCLALLFGLVLFIVASNAGSQIGATGCKVVGVMMQYFWLCALAWMVVEGINLYAIIVIIIGLDFERRMKFYLLAWSEFPILFVLDSL